MESCNPDMTAVIKAAEVNEKSHTNCEEGPTGILPKKDEPAVNRLDTDDATTPHCDGIHKTTFTSEKAPAGEIEWSKVEKCKVETTYAVAPKWNDKCITHNAAHCDGKVGNHHTKCPNAILAICGCEHDSL